MMLHSIHLSITNLITLHVLSKFLSLIKKIDIIDLPNIFQDKSVIQSIPTYFQNSEPHIICYKHNKSIRNTIFNFNTLVSDLDIHVNTPKS